MRRCGALLLAALGASGAAGALLRPTSPATQGDAAAMRALENLPVYLKPSSSSRRRPSFYVPRMREEQPTYQPFPAAALGTALPLFSITSTSCEYYALRLPLLKAGFKRVASATDGVAGNLVWGRAPHATRAALIAPHTPTPAQRFNHFPSSHVHLGCKRGLALHLRRMTHGAAAAAYDFSPVTWVYPDERDALFAALARADPTQHFIWKPARGSCGRGIRITPGGARHAAQWRQVAAEIDQRAGTEARLFSSYVVQSYLADPLLLDGRKMDLRLYVLVTSYDPLVVYWHEEGLVRLAAQPYDGVASAAESGQGDDAALGALFRHLTNYSIGRRYEATPHANDADTPVDHPPLELKWSLQRLWDHLDAGSQGTSGDAERRVSRSVQSRIAALIVRTLMAVKPTMSAAAYRSVVPQSYFELYGFDVMLDRNLTPHLIEVNTLPSLESSSAFDYVTKTNVVADALNLSLMEPFARDPAALQSLLPADKLLTLPMPELRPLVHAVTATTAGRQTDHALSLREELRCRLHDELQYARGFRRIFPPAPAPLCATPTDALCGDAEATAALRREAQRFAEMGHLSPLDEWALQNA